MENVDPELSYEEKKKKKEEKTISDYLDSIGLKKESRIKITDKSFFLTGGFQCIQKKEFFKYLKETNYMNVYPGHENFVDVNNSIIPMQHNYDNVVFLNGALVGINTQNKKNYYLQSLEDNKFTILQSEFLKKKISPNSHRGISSKEFYFEVKIEQLAPTIGSGLGIGFAKKNYHSESGHVGWYDDSIGYHDSYMMEGIVLMKMMQNPENYYFSKDMGKEI